MLESAILPLSHRVLLARAGHRTCRPQQIKLRLHLDREGNTTSRKTDGQCRNPNLVGLRRRLDREGTRHLERQMASVATQILTSAFQPARSHRDQRGRRDDLQRLDVVDFNAFPALQASQVDLVINVFEDLNGRIDLQLLHVDPNSDVEVTR